MLFMPKKYSNYQAIFTAPFATLGLKLNQQSICELDFIFEDVPRSTFQNEYAEKIAEQISCYIENPLYQLDLSVTPEGTKFQKSVWRQMRKIPIGSCLTYSEVAEELQSGPRAVGNACRKNPIPLIIPCHRIVAKNGLGGFAGETSGQLTEIKRWLLDHESCKIN